MKLKTLLTSATTLFAVSLLAAPQASAQAPAPKPNILVIMGDDIGLWNISAYNRGMMGYRTPNIDRIAREGAIFTDYYGQQIVHGRARRLHHRPVADPHRPAEGRPAGRAGGAVGEGPDHRRPAEAAGLRHRPVRQEPPRRPQRVPADRARLRRVLRQPLSPQRRGGAGEHRLSEGPDLQGAVRPARRAEVRRAAATETPGEDPRFGKWGKQRCEDTGPLTSKRMETVDEEFLAATLDFIDRANRDSKPFFVWTNSSRMHIWTHLKKASEGKTGLGVYADGMVEHDGQVGQLLKKLDDLGIADNTIVIYTTDNGAEVMSWPDGGTTPFRGEKNTNWEGGYRVPAMVRWPGLVKPGTEINEVFSARGLDADPAGRRRRDRPQGQADARRDGRRQDLQGPSRRLRPARAAEERAPAARARSSSTGPTTAGWPACATTVEARLHGAAQPRLRRLAGSDGDACACPSCSTSGPTRSSAPTRRAWATAAGASTASSCWCRRRPSSTATSRPWPSSRRARSRARSTWRACSTS